MTAVVVAEMVAVSEAVVVVAVEMIETRSSQGHKWDFCRGRQRNHHSNHYPILPLSRQLFHYT